ncbi:hypothetical protein WUBG_10060 [Wuchereria bancrofti]|uniref:Uncharacterized protein n=1 Tax=Wuchereria bancrofti TaxID=6293 RepID=J9E9P1_WUCBA|nr:hypothetical protein WUBG_10060 [Wuchereria bancrofti]
MEVFEHMRILQISLRVQRQKEGNDEFIRRRRRLQPATSSPALTHSSSGLEDGVGERWKGTDNNNDGGEVGDNGDKNDGSEVDGCGNGNKHWFSSGKGVITLLLGYFHILAVLFNPFFDFLGRRSMLFARQNVHFFIDLFLKTSNGSPF